MKMEVRSGYKSFFRKALPVNLQKERTVVSHFKWVAYVNYSILFIIVWLKTKKCSMFLMIKDYTRDSEQLATICTATAVSSSIR